MADAQKDPDKAARDQQLDALKKAYGELYKQEMRRTDAEEAFLRSLKARSSAQTLARKNVIGSKLLVIQDINTFLAG